MLPEAKMHLLCEGEGLIMREMNGRETIRYHQECSWLRVAAGTPVRAIQNQNIQRLSAAFVPGMGALLFVKVPCAPLEMCPAPIWDLLHARKRFTPSDPPSLLVMWCGLLGNHSPTQPA